MVAWEFGHRYDFQKLAGIRLEDAKTLLRNGRYEGCYYLSGYVVVGPDIEEGRRFLELLSKDGVQVDAAVWQKDEKDELGGRWRLLIVTPLVEELGVKKTYRRLDQILSRAPQRLTVDLLDVSVFTPESWFYKSLRRELRHARDLPITRRPVGDHFVDDGFIYFVK